MIVDFKSNKLFFEQEENLNLFYASVQSELKKNLIEIILYMELKKIDLVESRIKSFRKKQAKYLKANKENRVLDFLFLATYFYYNQDTLNRDVFMVKVEKSLFTANSEKEDLFMQSFYAWLKARITNKNLYKTTLQVVCAAK